MDTISFVEQMVEEMVELNPNISHLWPDLKPLQSQNLRLHCRLYRLIHCLRYPLPRRFLGPRRERDEDQAAPHHCRERCSRRLWPDSGPRKPLLHTVRPGCLAGLQSGDALRRLTPGNAPRTVSPVFQAAFCISGFLVSYRPLA